MPDNTTNNILKYILDMLKNMPPENIEFLKGLGVAILDSVLAYTSNNINNANFGTLTKIIVNLILVVVNNLRNRLHGGIVAQGNLMDELLIEVKHQAEEEGCKFE